MTAFAELAVTTNFSFLRGASHPKEFAASATLLGYSAIGIADRNTLAGVVRMYDELKQIREQTQCVPRQLVGARLCFVDGTPDILAYPVDREAYGRLCRLLSDGKLRAPKGECVLVLDDLLKWQEGLLLIVMPPQRTHRMAAIATRVWNGGLADKDGGPGRIASERFETRIKAAPDELEHLLATLARHAPGRIWLGAFMPHGGDDQRRLHAWQRVARAANVPLLATNDALYHEPGRRELQDVVTCIREGVTLNEAGRLLEANAERHLKSSEEMTALFAEAPEAVTETLRFCERIEFSLDQLRYNYPDEMDATGKSPQSHLENLVWKGARERYPHGIPEAVETLLKKELALIEKLQYAPYFLTVHRIVGFAKERGILCQGRGSAANSAVCYVLGITGVDPEHNDVLFERFISEERKEPPDIDVDFEHEEREKIIQQVYEHYGHAHAALTATVIHYRPRSAVREVAKVFGLSEDIAADLASGVWGSWGSRLSEAQVRQGKLDPFNHLIARTVKLANDLIGFPRHLSQHVGGFVLTKDRLDAIVPVAPAAMENRFFIEWDKDDLDRLGLMKVDVLALGMLTCIRKAFALIHENRRKPYEKKLTLATVPKEDPAVYDMLCKADAVGVFQVESRAQMSMLPRLKPREFYDLVVEVAIVRPGPIQGNMVHPYLQRRKHPELIVFPKPSPEHGKPDELESVLGKTKGVPLFQEQAMKLAMVAAEFTSSEANRLRRAMATFRNVGTIGEFETMMVERMVKRGYEREFAQNCFNQIKGFGSYGFPESHAASFAHLVYISAWIKKHHPAVFACALLNSQPMGFYAPAEIVRDAREHDVEVRHVDVNFSGWDNTLETDSAGGLALRLGFRQVDGFQEKWAKVLVEQRRNAYGSVGDVARRARLPKRALIILAEADCFQSQNRDRRQTLWDVRRLADDDALPLFAAQFVDEQPEEVIAPLPAMPQSEHVLADYQMLRLSLRAHLMAFLRDLFRNEDVKSCLEVTGDREGQGATAKDGDSVACAGIVLTRQMPGEAGVVFITLSDETGITNVVVWPRLVEPFRREIMGARLLLVEGKVQKSPEGVVHLVAERIVDRTRELDRLSEDDADAPSFRSQAAARHRHPRNVRVVPKSRDFH
jgi:error-prone DNA polymerase